LSGTVVIVRPEPGAAATAARAAALGLTAIVAPLFEVRPVAWDAPPPGRHDAILLTSAHAARLGGFALARLTGLPAYAVGAATARAAREAGFAAVRTGGGDGAALIALAAAEGATRPLHLCGRDRIPLRHPAIEVEDRVVYAADLVERPLEIPSGAVVLLHSPRAAAALAARVPDRGRVRIAAISAAAAAAAGAGWAAAAVAAAPCDEALLEVARALCQSGGPDAAGAGT
jgi:uroporphyrinogen-III synthase